MSKMKKFIRAFIAIVIIAGILFLISELLRPKYNTGVLEGSLVAEYYKQDNKEFDVIFVGDCEVYENFSPAKLWTEYGINSYIRGSAQQYIFQSYYLLEDTLRYYTPKVVVFNIQSLQYNESQSEPYNRMTIDGMKWSKAKVGCIKASMTEDESFVDYVFPIFRYHSRWSELTSDDFKYMFRTVSNSYNGYYMRVDSKPAENVPEGRPLTDYSFGDNAWSYLDKMRELCAANGIQLIMIKAPSLYPYWYPQWDKQVTEYAQKYDIPYINFIELADDIGLDYSKDTYDSGLHLNLTGAEKMSVYFGKILRDTYAVPDRRDDTALSAIWEQNIKDYEAEIIRQCEKYNVELTR